MRTITTAQAIALAASSRGLKFRVRVLDASSNWQDLTSIGGYSFLKALDWGETVDDPHITANVTLKQQSYQVSLSPFMTTSPVNTGWVYGASPFALLDLGRQVQIDVQYGAADVTDPGPWMTVFHGRIDKVASSGEDTITLECRDLSGAIQDTFIEKERVYGLGNTKGARIWEDSTAYALNERLLPAGALNGKYFKCTTAGTSGATEPSWNTTVGATTSDGTAVWTCEAATSSAGETLEAIIQKILDDNLTSAVTLYTPTGSSSSFGGFKQDREGTLEAVRRLAQMIGWDVRQKWRASTSQFELTLYQPDRTKTTADRTFAASEYRSITRAGVDIATIRNVVRVIYSDAAALASDGVTKKRKVVEVSDSASIAKYGRLFMEIAEDATSLIDSSSEATALATAALNDLSTPIAEFEVDAMFFPWAEIGDLYTFTANNFQFDADQKLAVTGARHSVSISDDGTVSASTTLALRGKPSGGVTRWQEIQAKPGIGASHKLAQFGGQTIVATTKQPGGVKLDIADDNGIDPFWDGAEIHLSTSSGFTPGPGTLKTLARSKSVTLGDLDPGQLYYAKPVKRGRNAGQPILGKPGPEISFTAARLTDIFFDPELGHTAKPPNGGFESWFNGTNALADHWSMVTGSFGASAAVYRSSTSHGGLYSLELRQTAVAAKVQSAFVPVEGGLLHELTAWVQRTADSALTFTIGVDWYSSAKGSPLSSSNMVNRSTTSLASAGWVRVSGQAQAPTNAAYARITIAKDTADASYGVLVDDVSLTSNVLQPLHTQDIGTSRTIASNVFTTVVSGSVVLTKPNQKILVMASYSAHSTAAGDTAGWQANLNSSPAVTSSEYIQRLSTVSAKEYSSFTCVLTGPANPGTYTLALQWRRNGGTGTITMDAADYATIVAIPL